MYVYDPEDHKQYPGEEPSIFNFFPKGLDLDVVVPSNDDLVTLYAYKNELFWDNVAKSRRRGEMIPTRGYFERLCNEVNIPYDDDSLAMLDRYIFAGLALSEERRLAAMTPEEREEHDRISEAVQEMLDDPASVVHEALNYALERVESQREEIETLNNLVSDEEGNDSQ